MANRASRRKAAAAARHGPAQGGSARASARARGPLRPDPAHRAAAKGIEDGDVAEPEALVVTNWFDPGADGEPYSATIRLTGHRLGASGPATGRNTFTHEEVIDGIVPGSGPMSISSWVYGLEPGEWIVTAEPVRPLAPTGRHGQHRPSREARPLLRPASWSWRRWTLGTAPEVALKTRWALPAPLARIPAVIPGSWPILGSLGVIAALLLQATILGHENIAAGPALAASVLALGVGLIGAKVWYAVLHRGSLRRAITGGWAVDGFLVVTFPVVAVVLLSSGLPVATVLDATAPGLFLAVAIGRVGCFLTGCCAGRLTHSRWGIWSSDRRIGGRRVPVQLIESFAGLALAIATWMLIHARIQGVDGATFIAGMAAYAAVRQVVLRLRAERREFSWRRSAGAAA